ncbi:MAG: sterol desaturase family protein [Acidimicrobiales bacterium]
MLSLRPRAYRRPLTTRLYLPAFSVVAAALAVLALGWWIGFGGADPALAVSDLRLVIAGPLSLAFLAAFAVAERVRPAQRRPLVARGHRQDLLFTVFNLVVVLPFTAVLGLAFSTVVIRFMPWLILPASSTVPRWLSTALVVVAMDACNWLAHLANHRNDVLYRFHELHHSQEDMNVLTVFRTHPLIHVSYLIALVPAIVLLANGTLTTTILVLYAAMVAFAHSNTNLGFGPLERIFVSPNFHRIHHKLDGPQDVNLGFTLTIWDQLAGLAVFPTADTIRTDTGLPGRPLAVEHVGDRPHHIRVFVAQLAGPFRPARPAPAAAD